MEPKKNPKIDLYNKRGLIFNFSLVLSLLVVISAFRWTTPLSTTITHGHDRPVHDEFLVDIRATDFNNIPEKPKPADLIKPQTIISNPEFVEVKDLPSSTPAIVVDPSTAQNPVINVDLPPEPKVDTTTWIFVETPPEPLGGMKGYFEDMQKNLKYPKRAVKTRTEGKVFVQFTIEPTGLLSNIKVIRGIGQGCDEEAARVISLSKWKPGKQRGKPVRVKMVQQVTFQLRSQD